MKKSIGLDIDYNFCMVRSRRTYITFAFIIFFGEKRLLCGDGWAVPENNCLHGLFSK